MNRPRLDGLTVAFLAWAARNKVAPFKAGMVINRDLYIFTARECFIFTDVAQAEGRR